jgi:hypothetical protein
MGAQARLARRDFGAPLNHSQSALDAPCSDAEPSTRGLEMDSKENLLKCFRLVRGDRSGAP